MPGKPRAVTQAEIAKQASTTVPTVSKVLNGRPGVSDELRAQIEAVVQRLGYQQPARKQQSARLIEVLCYEIDSPFGSEVVAHIEQAARQSGFGMVLTGSNADNRPHPGWVDDVVGRQPVGVVLIACRLSEADRKMLRSRNIRIVAIDPAGTPAPDIPSIGSADWKGGYLATRHLIDLGHRRIGIITGPADMMASTARQSGYTAALEAAGIPIEPSLIRPGQFHHADGLAEGLALLSRPDRPTAIFASSDLYALGVYEAARSLGIGIPDELSVVGYDDLRIAQWAGPPLTTVHVPLARMAQDAVHLIQRLGEEPELSSSRTDIETTLVVRASTTVPTKVSN
ncbi:LacI family DNA-binding transcriptional regulator [Paractinoplanes rhizophilus]|uniref:LacI family DNA-binding transcriptional regulator n=1 Tax=Paractinoplanes rhizophilus TaxID=1416877 RepID=A0ABW2HIJ2_9ACTN|nr:LacI family DNA-binding transcriptional regulator [Actinoplanes sp.]